MLALYALIAVVTIQVFGGTGDLGDSIHHYQYARYAPVHPELYFNHWAKPVFVLLASPFAQFGFLGMKVFNAIVSGFVLLVTYRCAKKLGYTYPVLAAVFVLGMPLFYILTFSGLTEPLFALFLVTSVYFCLRKRYRTAAMIVSFMPFVRSEGLIMVALFAFYFLYRRQFWAVLLLCLGHVVYSVAGYFVYRDLFWVITQIPYARMDSYGKGKLFHFVEQLYYVIGLPIYGLMVWGLLGLALPWINRKKYNSSPEEAILVAGGFLAFLLAHSLFWYLGIFHSMGLKRVMLCVAPLMALLASRGLHQILAWIPDGKKRWRLVLAGGVLLAVAGLLVSEHPTGIHFQKTMQPGHEQRQAQRIPELLHKFPQRPRAYVFSHPYLAEVLNIDPFDPNVHKPFSYHSLRHLQPNDVIIWDAHFSVMEDGITEKDMQSHPVREWQRLNDPNGQARFVLYQPIF